MFVGCASSKKINGTQYDSVGLATMNNMDECVRYKLIFGNVFWSLSLSALGLLPTIYFLGWSILEPVGEKYTGCLQKREESK